MSAEEITLKNADGLNLYVRQWGSPASARALVLLVHGLGEHCQRYGHIAAAMEARDLCLIGYDQRGHGLSQGKRGVIGSEAQLMGDIGMLLEYTRQLNPSLPLFLYGHSLGALEVLYFVLRNRPELKGVIATSPPLDTSTMSAAQKTLVKVLVNFLPNLTVSSGLNVNGLSRDAQVVHAYQQDPLIHDRVSIRLGSFLQTAPGYVLTHAGEWSLPLYLAHGSADPICPIAGSRAFARQVSAPDFTFREWQGLYHETHNEPEQAQVIATVTDWIEAHI